MWPAEKKASAIYRAANSGDTGNPGSSKRRIQAFEDLKITGDFPHTKIMTAVDEIMNRILDCSSARNIPQANIRRHRTVFASRDDARLANVISAH